MKKQPTEKQVLATAKRMFRYLQKRSVERGYITGGSPLEERSTEQIERFKDAASWHLTHRK